MEDGCALPTGSKAKCQPGPLLRAPQAQLPSPLPAVLHPLQDSLCSWQHTAPRPCTLAVGPPACPAAVPHAWARHHLWDYPFWTKGAEHSAPQHRPITAGPCFTHRLSINYSFNSKSITASEVIALEKVLLERSHRALMGAPGCLNQLSGTVVMTTPGKESIFQCKLQAAE